MISVQNIKLRRISINPPPPPPPSWADSEAAFVRTIASDRDSVRIGNLKIGFKFLERLAAETTDTTLRPLTMELTRFGGHLNYCLEEVFMTTRGRRGRQHT